MERVLAGIKYRTKLNEIRYRLMHLYTFGGVRDSTSLRKKIVGDAILHVSLKGINYWQNISPNAFTTAYNYSVQVVENVIKKFKKRDHNAMRAGKKFHMNIQKQLIKASTLSDILRVAFPGVFYKKPNIHKPKGTHKSTSEKLTYHILARRDAHKFILRCAKALGPKALSSLTISNGDSWKKFCDSVKVIVLTETPTLNTSNLPHRKRTIKRIPDCVIFATHPAAGTRIWQCVIELKTKTMLKKTLKQVTEVRAQFAKVGSVFCPTSGLNLSNNKLFPCQRAIYQAVDTLSCVNNTLKHTAMTYSKESKMMGQNAQVYYDAYVWIGFKGQTNISCSQMCLFRNPMPHTTNLNGPMFIPLFDDNKNCPKKVKELVYLKALNTLSCGMASIAEEGHTNPPTLSTTTLSINNRGEQKI